MDDLKEPGYKAVRFVERGDRLMFIGISLVELSTGYLLLQAITNQAIWFVWAIVIVFIFFVNLYQSVSLRTFDAMYMEAKGSIFHSCVCLLLLSIIQLANK